MAGFLTYGCWDPSRTFRVRVGIVFKSQKQVALMIGSLILLWYKMLFPWKYKDRDGPDVELYDQQASGFVMSESDAVKPWPPRYD